MFAGKKQVGIAAVAVAGVCSVVMVSGQQPAGPFTAEQASSGKTAYTANCSGCHMPDLGGRNEAAYRSASIAVA